MTSTSMIQIVAVIHQKKYGGLRQVYTPPLVYGGGRHLSMQ